MKIGFLQSGGPTAVLNASLAGALGEARARGGIETHGAAGGISAMLQDSWRDLSGLSGDDLRVLAETPGAALGCRRQALNGDDMDRIAEHCVRFDAILINGGNGSMAFADGLASRLPAGRPALIGIPKTVDNDLCGTDWSPGYPSAASYVIRSVRDLLMDVRSLPPPVSIFETMGRDAGWLAAAALLARDAPGAPPHAIHLPEAPPDRRTFLDGVEQALADDGFALVVVSEGLHWKDGSPIVPVLEEQNDAMGRPLPGDVASHLAALASRELGVRARSEKPGLLGRCSLASSSDRRDALAVGAAAVSAACAGHTRVMVSLSRAADGTAQTRLVPLAEAAGRHRPFPGEWISNDDISPRFAEYLAPLIEEPPPGRFTLPPLSP